MLLKILDLVNPKSKHEVSGTRNFLLFVGALVVLTLIITALGVEVRDIPAELLTILIFIIMAAIATIVSVFKK